MSLEKDLCRILGHEDNFPVPCPRCGESPFDSFVKMTEDKAYYDYLVKEVAKVIYRRKVIKGMPVYNGHYVPVGYNVCGFALDDERAAIRKKWFKDVDAEVEVLKTTGL